jgi:predicted CXXCH cytochrome family protein
VAVRRRYLKFFLILLFVPAAVLAEVAGVPLPLSLEEGEPLPFDCATCHAQMARRLEHSACLHELPGTPRPEVRCCLCHVDTRQACRFATVRDEEPKYLHTLKLSWPREGRYRLRLRSKNTRGDSIRPPQGAYSFDTRQEGGAAEPEPSAEDPGRLRIRKVSLRRLQEGGALSWETNLRADAEAVCWPAEAKEHLPLKDERSAGIASCRECHPPQVWVVSHPVGVSLRPSMQDCDLPVGEGSEIICATCHDPHGSRQAYLLRKDQDRLCRTCHKGY